MASAARVLVYLGIDIDDWRAVYQRAVIYVATYFSTLGLSLYVPFVIYAIHNNNAS